MVIFKKITIIAALIISLWLITMGISDYIQGRLNTSFPGTSFASCLNDKTLATHDRILVGTSVTQELTDAAFPLIFEGDPYFNCGVSAHTVNFIFHQALIVLLNNKVGLRNKKIIVEVSLQSVLSDSHKFEPEFQKIAPSLVKLITLYDLSANNIVFDNYYDLFRFLIINLVPTAKLAYLQLRRENSTRVNAHHGKKFDPTNVDPGQLKMFSPAAPVSTLISKTKLNLTVFSLLSKLYGFELVYLIPPSNSSFTRNLDDSYTNIVDLLIKRDDQQIRVIDLRNFDNPAYFSDCCHLNEIGQSLIRKHLANGS